MPVPVPISLEEAVQRILDGLGFRSSTSLRLVVEKRLREAQWFLETGKTLPHFLKKSDEEILLEPGDRIFPLPDRFIREFDEELPHYVPPDGSRTVFLERWRYSDAVKRFGPGNGNEATGAPRIYTLRHDSEFGGFLDFIIPVDKAYTLLWSYYKGAALLDVAVNNQWLQFAPDWLVGEAGWRVAMDIRDERAIQVFDQLRTSGRMSVFHEEFVLDEAAGQFAMGEHN